MPYIRPSAKMFYFFSKNSLPITPMPALGKVWIFLKKFFAECPLAGTRQSLIFFKFFAEYHGHGTRQSWKNGFSSAHFSSFVEWHSATGSFAECNTRQSDPKRQIIFFSFHHDKYIHTNIYHIYISSITYISHPSHIYLIHHIYISSIHTSIRP